MQNNAAELLRVEGLKKNFGKLEVLRDINVSIHEGEVVAVIGPSGGGKSTFLRCLNLLETPSAGRILFEGADLSDKKVDLDKHRRRSAWCSSSSTCSTT